ncbi:MAG: PAS domain S-box protein [Acidobacteriota bacterium]
MARKTSAAKKTTTSRDLFFDQPSAVESSACASDHEAQPADSHAVRLERRLQLLRQELLRLQHEYDHLKQASELASFGSMELDCRGLILTADQTLAGFLQTDAASIQGTAFVSYLPERFHQKFLSFLHHVLDSGISQSIDIPVVRMIDDEYRLRLVCRASAGSPKERTICCVLTKAERVQHPGSGADGGKEEGLFRQMAERSGDWMMWIGADGSLLWVSKGVEGLTGYTPHECAAMPDFPYPLIAEEDREMIAELIAEGGQGTEDGGVEFRYRCKNGTREWGFISCYPMYESAGQALGYCLTVRSMAHEKELEEELSSLHRLAERGLRTKPAAISKKFFEQVINALGDLVFAKSHDGRYTLVNDSFIEFTGLTREEILGRTDHELFRADEAEMFVASDRAVFDKQHEFLVEELFTRKDGQQRRVLVKKNLNVDEYGEPFIVGVLRDVTELRNAEDDVRAALAKERELNDLKSRFVTMVSHEYKTPLTAILSSAELLELFRKSWNDEKVELHLQKIKRAVETMTEMLTDALFLNKIETGRVPVASNTFELVSFCIMIADEVQACAMHQNRIETSSSVTHALVSTDNRLLRYILTNLLSNAVKYSYAATSIQFETVLREQTATFRVRNRGIGIPPEHQGMLFEPFFRAPNTGTIQGSGLGLSIVKRCVDTLKGTVSVDSVPNEATVFTVTIPLDVLEYHTGIARGVPKSFQIQ